MAFNRSKPPTSSRAKWGLVVLLVLALIYVITRPGDKPPPATAAKPAVRRGKQTGRDSGKQKPRATRPLEPASLDTVLSFNPFEFDGKCVVPQKRVSRRTPEPPPRPAVAARKPKPPDRGKILRKAVAGQEADIILESSRGRSARVGKRIIREGQPFDPGVVVRRIQRDHVILEVKPRKEGR